MKWILPVLLLVSVVCTATAQEDATKKDLKELQGNWKVKELRTGNKEADQEMPKHMRAVIAGDKLTTVVGEDTTSETFTLDATKNPRAIDITRTLPQIFRQGEKPRPTKQETVPGIYSIDRNTLKLCLSNPGSARPTEFVANAALGHALLVLERDKSASAKIRLNDVGELSEIRRLGASAFYAGRGPIEEQQLYVILGDREGDEELKSLAPHLKRMSHITGLHLHDSQVTDAGLAHLKGSDNIGHLNLSKTRITDAGLEQLKGMAHLEFLILTGTQVTDAGIAALKKALPKLHVEKLTAAQERANDEINKAGGILFSEDGSIIKIRFDGRKLTDADLARLKEHLEVWKGTLKELDLSRSKISDAGLEHLKGLTSLRQLQLIGTGVTDAGMNALKQSLPKLVVKR